MAERIIGVLPEEPQEPPPPIELPPPTEEELAYLARIDRILAGQEPPPLMTTPPEVEQIVNRLVARLDEVLPEERQRVADDLNLQYYHGGNPVLTWQTPKGRAVLAVGLEQIQRVLDHLSDEQRLQVLEQFPDPWASSA